MRQIIGMLLETGCSDDDVRKAIVTIGANLMGFRNDPCDPKCPHLAGDVVIGTFVKSPSMEVAEVLGLSGLDFVVIDLIRTDATDLLVLAGPTARLPLLSRRWGAGDCIAPLMDLCLVGEMVPHVVAAGRARTVCSAVKFAHGAGEALRSFRRQQRHHGTDRGCPALGRPDEIAACADIDVLFVSAADLSQPKGRRALSRAG